MVGCVLKRGSECGEYVDVVISRNNTDGGSMFLRNTGIFLQADTAVKHRGQALFLAPSGFYSTANHVLNHRLKRARRPELREQCGLPSNTTKSLAGPVV
jgi:hypothetical protein